jgi:hypothetical protein
LFPPLFDLEACRMESCGGPYSSLSIGTLPIDDHQTKAQHLICCVPILVLCPRQEQFACSGK